MGRGVVGSKTAVSGTLDTQAKPKEDILEQRNGLKLSLCLLFRNPRIVLQDFKPSPTLGMTQKSNIAQCNVARKVTSHP